MRKILLAAVATTGLFSLSTMNASAEPSHRLSDVHARPTHGLVTRVDYDWHHHHWHHRRWDHGHWRYWN